MVFEIIKAERKGSKVVIQLAGMSNSGKTYSAIRLARGLIGNEGKIGAIDTEQRRMSLYADNSGGFDVINMEAPYTPERYSEAIDVFKNAGYNCVIIDSMSHEWAGVGGVIDIAEDQKYKNGKPMSARSKWKIPKARHKAMMEHMLHCGMHIVCCYRAKKPLEDKTVDGKTVMVEGALEIVTENKNAYDVTISLILDEVTKKPSINKGRCPEGIEYLFDGKKQISEETGRGIISWFNNKQRDKDTLIREGRKQKDVKTWGEGLSDSERYLARKYYSQMKPKEEPKPEPEEESLDNL